MKLSLILLIILSLCSCSLKEKNQTASDFLKEQKASAKDYVLNQFKENDIVIICERDHKEFTQYELFLDIIKDPYFIENVGHIFTEVGVANMDSEINKFLQSEFKDSLTTRNQITSIFRDIDYTPYWHCYNFPWFLSELYKLNQGLSEPQKVLLHPSDMSFSWYDCNTALQYKEFDNSTIERDSIMAVNIINRINQIKKTSNKPPKALVIMNYSHAFLKDYQYSDGRLQKNTGRFLKDVYHEKIASIYLMGLGIPSRGNYTVIKNGEWDNIFAKSRTQNVGFTLKNSPFGLSVFDAIPKDYTVNNYSFQDMFTGLIYYKPLRDHKLISGWDEFTTEDFVPELRRRIEIFSKGMEMGLSEDDINEQLFKNNTETISRYPNIEDINEKIDKWNNGL